MFVALTLSWLQSLMEFAFGTVSRVFRSAEDFSEATEEKATVSNLPVSLTPEFAQREERPIKLLLLRKAHTTDFIRTYRRTPS